MTHMGEGPVQTRPILIFMVVAYVVPYSLPLLQQRMMELRGADQSNGSGRGLTPMNDPTSIDDCRPIRRPVLLLLLRLLLLLPHTSWRRHSASHCCHVAVGC